MNNAYYNIYLNNTLELVRSLVIKLDCQAKAMNRYLVDINEPIPRDKRQWRYYMHLAGEYHYLDEPMLVKSLDDGTEIVFNQENLKRHKKTRSVYKYNRVYVNALIERYPMQSKLVKGVLRPLDINRAVNVKDGTVLYYEERFIEPQEQSLIRDMEQWIRGYMYQNMMDSYSETDDLFITTQIGVMCSLLVKKIMDIRATYTKTAEVHSFHIKCYLASHHHLDEFYPYLTRKQLLFLYRNIEWINQHTGHSQTYQKLIDELLTARRLPTFEYSLQHQEMDVAAGEVLPKPQFVRKQINLNSGFSSRDINLIDIDSVIRKELPLARDNGEFFDHYADEAQELAAFSSINQLPTKMMEVSAVDPEDVEPIKLIDCLLNEWAHMTTLDLYENTVEVINPLNADTMKLRVRDAFLLYIYASAAGFHGVKMDDIPEYLAVGVMSKDWIGYDDYIKLLEHDHFEGWEDDIDYFVNTQYEVSETIRTAEEFMDVVVEIMKKKRARHLYCYEPHRDGERAARKKMYDYSYRNIWCKLDNDWYKTYNDFFLSLALDHEKVSRETWQDLSMEVLNKATGYGSANIISLKDTQAAMVRLFKRLSSYSIQFAQEIVSDDTIVANPLFAMPDTTSEHVTTEAFVPADAPTVLKSAVEVVGNAIVERSTCTIQESELIEDRTYFVDPHVYAEVEESVEVTVAVTRSTSTIHSVELVRL